MAKDVFTANNTMSARNVFKARRRYKYLARPDFGQDSPPFVDFWYEDSLYGKIDSLGDAIYPITDRTFTVDLIRGNSKSVNSLFFVEKAFHELKSKYSALVIEGLVNSLPSYDKFEVKKGLTPLDRIYEKHVAQVMKYFVNQFLPKHNKCIVNFDDFVKYCLLFLRSYAYMTPITKTGFVMLPSTPNSISGLVLDLEYANHSNDSEKKDFFTKEACRLEAFLALAHREGFLMDKNAPWRIVANVKSPKINPDSNVLEKYYFKTYREDAHGVMRFVHNSYQLYFRKNPNIFLEKEGKSGRIIRKAVKRQIESDYLSRPAGPARAMGVNFWADMTLRTRIYETVRDSTKANELIGNFVHSRGDMSERLHKINTYVKSHDTRLDANSLHLNRYSETGSTSDDADHRHIYRLDKDGNGYTEYAHHPSESKISHRHEVRNWEVLPSSSSCAPHCKERFGYAGVPTHRHIIDRRGKIGKVYTTS